MPDGTASHPTPRVQRSAKSCVECRRRKIRCVRSASKTPGVADDRTSCEYCLARGRACAPQTTQSKGSSRNRTPARERISGLEREIASLASLVKETSRNAIRDSTTSVTNQGPGVLVSEGLDTQPSHVGVPDTSPPSHLKLLFDDFTIDSHLSERNGLEDPPPSPSNHSTHLARAKHRLLLPSLEEVMILANYASGWMSLYYNLFPTSFSFFTENQLIEQYDLMKSHEVNPVTLAMYLLTVAITAQQLPPGNIATSFYKSQGVTKFVDDVCRAVEQTIINNDSLAGTAESLEMAMLYVRLSLGRGDLNKTWLTFRRIVALAELIGLPQAQDNLIRALKKPKRSKRANTQEEKSLERRADVWEGICATDRNFSMMLNIPAVTARYRFPRDDSVVRNGEVSLQAYNYRLSNVCIAVSEIDESYMHEATHAESYEKVLTADRLLRALAASAPKHWWLDSDVGSVVDKLVKFWHHYLVVRVHLRPGMMGGVDEQYAYSRMACRTACYNAVRLFSIFRTQIPSGFFVCQVLDVQAFTAATFLLLNSKPSQHEEQTSMDPIPLVQNLVDCFASVSNECGSSRAREALAALKSLIALVQGDRSERLDLRIPLLGKIRIGSSHAISSSQEAPSNLDSNFSHRESQFIYQDGIMNSDSAIAGLVGDQNTYLTLDAPIPWLFEFDDVLF